MCPDVKLVPLSTEDREQFIIENQYAFKFGALEEFGMRNNEVDEDGEIISRKTIEQSLDDPKNHAYRILADDIPVGGMIVKIDDVSKHNHLEILYINPDVHGKGIGQNAWKLIEEMYPDTEIWETFTPYFEKRNIHFRRCPTKRTPKAQLRCSVSSSVCDLR